MSWIDALRFRARALRRGRLEHEFDDELQFHLDQSTREYIARGMDPKEACRATRRDFGVADHTKEDLRAARGL